MPTKKTTTKGPGIPSGEWEAAASYFTMSNLAAISLVPQGMKNINQAYSYVDSIMVMETGCSMQEEYIDWYKEVKASKAGDYVTEEWAKQKPAWEF